MSRIGKSPVTLPDKVSVTIDGATVSAKGPRGELTTVLPEYVSATTADGEIVFSRDGESRSARAAYGLGRTLVANMVEGVSTGFRRKLIIKGVGYRCEKKGDDYLLFILGFSHPILYELPKSVTAEVDTKLKEANAVGLTLEGPSKQVLGQVAADIRAMRPPEPYKGKGIRYADETIIRKEGKAGAK